MQKLNLNLNYDLKYPEGTAPKDITIAQSELSKSYIEYAVTSAYKEGLSSQFRRLYAKIEKKITQAIESKTYEVELEAGEMDFIKRAFESENCKFNATIAKYVVTLEDEIFGTSNN